MICLTLFWNFLMIGTLSFGGGYGMISLVREVVLEMCIRDSAHAAQRPLPLLLTVPH